MRIDYWEVEELAAAMLNRSREYENGDIDWIEDAFYEKFNVDLVDLEKIVRKLIPMIVTDISPITNEPRRGFANGLTYIVKAIGEK